MLTDYHVHLRPDDPGTAAELYFTAANAERYREAAQALRRAAAQWTSFMWFVCGARVGLMPGSLDPARVGRTVADEGVQSVTVVGDAVAKPLLSATKGGNHATCRHDGGPLR